MHATQMAGLALLGSVLTGMTAVGGETIPAQKLDGKIRWTYGYEEGKRQARETGKPLFVVFRCER